MTLHALESRAILVVENYAEVRRFYETLLRLPVALEWGNGEGPGCIISLGPGRSVESIGPPPGGFPEDWKGFDRRAVMLGVGVADAAAALARLAALGVPVARELRDNPWGDRSFGIDDPAGVRVWVYEITDSNYAARLGIGPAGP